MSTLDEQQKSPMMKRGEGIGRMYTLYSMQRSGNSYKVRLALAKLNIPFELVESTSSKATATRRNFSR